MTANVKLTFDESGDEIINWENYSFQSDFFTPADGFSLTVGDEKITQAIRDRLKPGTKVQLKVNYGGADDKTICTGFIDKVSIRYSRAGTFLDIAGRDIMGVVCDAGQDPWSTKFKESMTLGDVLGAVFDKFDIIQFYTTDIVNRQVVTGNNKDHSIPTVTTFTSTEVNLLSPGKEEVKIVHKETVYSDPTKPVDLTQFHVKDLKPEVGTTAFEFASSIAKRFHLSLSAMADGSGVVICAPDYDQPVLFALDSTNIINCKTEISYESQPAVIIAKGFAGGGDFANTRIRCAKVNEFIGYKDDGTYVDKVKKILSEPQYKGLAPLGRRIVIQQRYAKYFGANQNSRAVFLEDKESRTIQQLEGFVLRKMAEYQKHALQVHATVDDHVYSPDGISDPIPWKHNTLCHVNDPASGINEVFWVMSVTFKKSRSGGTTTDLVLVPSFSIDI